MTDHLAPARETARVSTLELFFDLVFVFTVTQITEVVDHHPGVEAVLQGLLILSVLFWMYGGFAWLTNAMGTDRNAARLTVLAGMAALFVCSQAVPQAFGMSGIAMGIAFLALTLIHLGGFLWLGGPGSAQAILRLAPVNLGGALLILAAGWTHGVWDWVLWGTAAVLFLSVLVRNSTAARFTLQAGHFAERHGLMIIIVLGESLISVALAAQQQDLDLRLVAGCLLGVLAISTMWWAYFVGDDELGAQHLAGAEGTRRARMATVGYDLSHLAMIAGIIGVAAGTRLGLDDLLAPAEPAGAWLIAGGAAGYLAATAWFRGVLLVGGVIPRLAAALVLVGTAWVGVGLGTAQQLGCVAVVIGAAIAVDRRLDPVARNRTPVAG